MRNPRTFPAPVPALAALAAALFLAAPAASSDAAAAEFQLTKASARPGEKAVLTASVDIDPLIEGIMMSLNFDESKVRVVELRFIPGNGDIPFPAPSSGVRATVVNNVDSVPGDQKSEGWLHVELKVPALSTPVKLTGPTPVMEITFLVLPGALPGFTPITFETVGPLDSAFLGNGVTTPKGDIEPTGIDDGGVEIIGEVGFFMRGDSTFDQTLDIADPVMTLTALFLGGVDLPCRDSADANDDGQLDIVDPIVTLYHIFLGGPPLPDPVWGKDPTPDDLGCAYYPAGS